MHINHILRRFRKFSRLGRALSGTLLSAVMLLQPFSPVWAVDRLTSSQSWYVLNETGIDTLGVQRLRITGPDAEAFTIEGYTGSPTGMMPSQDIFTPALKQKTPSTPLGVSLRFTPQHSGDHQASLEVTHDGTNASPQNYPLTGKGDWDLTVDEDAGTIDFGTRAMGMPAVTLDGFLRSAGAHGWLTVTGMKLEGSPDFTLAQAGLANKGSATWGTGANLDVRPVGATESIKQFKGADLSVGGLTDAAARVRYVPNSRGPQSAKLTVYHDAPGSQSEYLVTADGVRGTDVTWTQGNPSAAIVSVTDFPRAGQGSAAITKTVYLKATGSSGAVKYSSLEVETSGDIQVISAYLIGNGGLQPGTLNRYNCTVLGVHNQKTIPALVVGESKQSAALNLTGTAVQSACSFSSLDVLSAVYPHLALEVRYTPKTPGLQTAKIKVFHNGNDEGYSELDISGDVFRDVSVQATGTNPMNAVASISNFTRASPGGSVQTKTVYLKATGTAGAVTYSGISIEGTRDIYASQVVLQGAGGASGPWSLPACSNPITGTVQTFPTPGFGDDGQVAKFSLTGTNVSTACRKGGGTYEIYPVTPHLAITLRYAPNAIGQQQATIKVYHDGNAQGFTTFDISGEAY